MTDKYLPPLKSELRKMGYLRRFVRYEATDAIIANLTLPTNKLAYMTYEYLSQYKSIVNIVRHPIGVYAYGINNLSKFNNQLDNATYQSSLILYRRLIDYHNRTYPDKQFTSSIPNKLILSLSETIYTYCKEDATELADIVIPKPKVYDTNGWYSKLLTK